MDYGYTNQQDTLAIERDQHELLFEFVALPQDDADIYLIMIDGQKAFDIYIPYEHPMSLPFAALWGDVESRHRNGHKVQTSAQSRSIMHLVRFAQGFAHEGWEAMPSPN